MTISARPTQIFSVSQLGEVGEILFPERVRVAIGAARKRPLDIGAFAYSVRSNNDGDNGHAVDLSSLMPRRKELVRKIIDFIYISAHSSRTTLYNYRQYKKAIDWCDAENRSDTFCNLEKARESYWMYTEHIRGRVLVDKTLGPMGASALQSGLRELIRIQFPNDWEYIVSGVQALNFPRSIPEPPRDTDVRQYLDLCLRVALQYSDFVLSGKSFPFRFELEAHVVHLFADTRLSIGPFSRAFVPRAYNVKEGRLSTVEEYLSLSPTATYGGVLSTLTQAQSYQDQCNRDLRCSSRMRLASSAMYAFASLFCLATASNISDFVQFTHKDAESLIESVFKKEFKAIKGRANGQETLYTLGRKSGLILLQKYLRLREWILNGAECHYLFFPVLTSEFKPLHVDFMSKFFRRMRGRYVPLDAKGIASGAARKYKNLVLHEFGIAHDAIASSLNNSRATNFKSYSSISVDKQAQEFSSFWAAVRAAKVILEDNGVASLATPSGHCADFQKPQSLIIGTAIAPNCESQFGCLFCEHYLCHADEEDVHKLLSLQYVTEAVRRFAPDFPHGERLFQSLSVRLRVVISAIEAKSDRLSILVSDIRNKVYTLGVLTPFWEKRLSRYEKLGLVQ